MAMIKCDPELNDECMKAKEALFNHGVVAFPTETVMGLGVIFNDKLAYDKLNQIKRRPEDKPYTMMVSNVEQIEKYAVIDERTRKIINKFMPGSITLLLPVKENAVPNYVTHNTNVIGIRIPTNIEAKLLLEIVDTPLLVPSANRSGEKPALNSQEVENIFQKEVNFIIQGASLGEVPSTIVDLTNKEIKVVRKGPISEKEILEIIKG